MDDSHFGYKQKNPSKKPKKKKLLLGSFGGKISVWNCSQFICNARISAEWTTSAVLFENFRERFWKIGTWSTHIYYKHQL
jgi:hypothetical protein